MVGVEYYTGRGIIEAPACFCKRSACMAPCLQGGGRDQNHEYSSLNNYYYFYFFLGGGGVIIA